MRKEIILGIESSCDETAIAIVEGGTKILSNVVLTSMDIFKEYGGVVPEIASRKHVEFLSPCLDKALKESGLSLNDVDAIAVTAGPGLVGALLCGVAFAKALSFATGKPLIAVNHMKGHICANYLTHNELKPPFMCLTISGGHTEIVNVKDYHSFELVGATLDDAVGEVFDKVARVLGLPYPGGPNVEKLSRDGVAKYELPKPLKGQKGYDFSFSGLKTAVMNLVNSLKQKGEDFNEADVAKTFQHSVEKILSETAVRACKDYGIHTLVLAGGVSANMGIRDAIDKACKNAKIEFFVPKKELCTDNAAMIACAGYYEYINGSFSDLYLNASPALELF